jgi:hypothetical protein
MIGAIESLAPVGVKTASTTNGMPANVVAL